MFHFCTYRNFSCIRNFEWKNGLSQLSIWKESKSRSKFKSNFKCRLFWDWRSVGQPASHLGIQSWYRDALVANYYVFVYVRGQVGLRPSFPCGFTSGEMKGLSVVRLSAFVICSYVHNYTLGLFSTTFTKFYRLSQIREKRLKAACSYEATLLLCDGLEWKLRLRIFDNIWPYNAILSQIGKNKSLYLNISLPYYISLTISWAEKNFDKFRRIIKTQIISFTKKTKKYGRARDEKDIAWRRMFCEEYLIEDITLFKFHIIQYSYNSRLIFT